MSYKDSTLKDKIYRGFRLHNTGLSNPNVHGVVTSYRVTLDNPSNSRVTFASEDDACKAIDRFLGDADFPELQEIVRIIKGIKPNSCEAKKLMFADLNPVVNTELRRISLD